MSGSRADTRWGGTRIRDCRARLGNITLIVVSFSEIPTQHRATTATAPDATAPEWGGMTFLRAGAELLLGLSFIVATAFGGYAAITQHPSIVAQLAAITFMCSLVCVLVNWFTAPATDEHRLGWE